MRLSEITFSRLPADWSATVLSNVIQPLTSGSRPAGGGTVEDEGVFSIGGEHITNDGTMDFSSPVHVPFDHYERIRTEAEVEPHDILINKDGANTGKLALVREDNLIKPSCINEHVFRVRTKNDLIDSHFLFYWLFSPQGQRQIQALVQGSAQPGINQRISRQVLVALPPTADEQKAIAEILDAVDAAIERTRAAIDKAQLLKRGLMQKLLPQWFGLKHVAPDFLGTEIEVVLASRVARVANGSTPSRIESAYWRGGTIPWLPTGKVNDGIITHAGEFVTEKALAECSIELLPPGTVLVGMVGQGKTRGMSAFLSMSACINQNFGAFVPGPRLDGKFLYHYLCQHYGPLREIGGGTNQGALNCYILKRLRLPVPPIEQQKQIASVLDACASVEVHHRAVLDKLECLKRGLMQDLLTGKVRVAAKPKS